MSRRVRYPVPCADYLRGIVLSLDDDYTLPWDTYPCITWDRNCDKDGYGSIATPRVNRKKTTKRVHREAWELVHGKIPCGALTCHHCDNPPCFRPIHLFLGSNSANMRDCVAKGRHICTFDLAPRMRGSGHANSKLTEDQARDIRLIYGMGEISQSKLASHYGVSQGLIGHVVTRKSWTHI